MEQSLTARSLTGADLSSSSVALRVFAFASLSIIEVFITSFAFNFSTALTDWTNPVAYAKTLAQAGLLAFVVLAILMWPDRAVLRRAWDRACEARNLRTSVLANVVIFAALFAATIGFSDIVAHSERPPWSWFALYCGLLLITGLSLALVAAPLSFWRWLSQTIPSKITIALLSALVIVLAGRLSMTGWGLLSGATLRGSHWILTLYEKDVFLDAQQGILGAGGFNVLVLKECSGYEGIGLVLSFLALYCVFMRRRLRFPHAFVLFPIGLATVWLMNCVRIATLVSIGRHLSPTIALDGFHSQAGWIGFLIVTIGVMVVSQKSSFFRRPRNSQTSRRLVDEPQVAFLAPFAVLMATSVIASLFAPHDQWLYVLKVVSVAAILGYFWRSYDSIWAPASPISIVIGVVAGVVWAATDPSAGDLSALTAWLDSQPPWLRMLWLSLRSAGLVLCVPMAEELAFRGYLQRVLISLNFSRVAPGQFSWLSFVMTSALFGLLHERWFAAALAGALYSCLTYRTNRLSDAIAAHVTTNAVILIWAIAAGQLSLL